MITLPHESNIVFSFPDDWHPVQYDTCEPYINKMMPLQNACAVDFLCCCNNRLIFMEVMRFKEKTLDDPVWVVDKVSTQAKDTICGLAVFHMIKESSMELYAQALFAKSPTKEAHKLIAFIEIENMSEKLNPMKVKADILDKLRKRFVPLGFAVRVLDSHDISKAPWKAEIQ